MSNKNFNFCFYLLVEFTLLLFGLSTSKVNAEEPSSYCYAIDDLGSVDLSELCIKIPRKANGRRVFSRKLSVTDRDFIEAYKQEINELPAIRDNILTKLDRSPISEVNQAKSICHRTTSQLEKQSDRSENTNAEQVLETLARQFYCPQTIRTSEK